MLRDSPATAARSQRHQAAAAPARPGRAAGAALAAPGQALAPAAAMAQGARLERLLAAAGRPAAVNDAVHDAEPATWPATAPAGPQARSEARDALAARDAVLDAPAETYIVPFDRQPLAAPGERIIFRAEFTDPSPASYRLDFSSTGGHFDTANGPTNRSIAGLQSGNVDFFVPAGWLGLTTVQVVLKLVKVADNSTLRTETWNFGLKNRYPSTMTQRETTGERDLPAVYGYDIGPVVVPLLPPFYEHTTILERFGNWTLANIGPSDIREPYRSAQGLNSAAAVSQHFLGNYAGGNGTFTVDANDRIYDQHGGHPNLANLVAQLAAPKDIEVALPQTYEARPGVPLGNYLVTRILKADGTTWKVKKG